jgi:integrase
MNYLLMARYIGFNPLSLMRQRQSRQHSLEESKIRVLERMLELDEWQALLQALKEMSDSSPHERDEKERLRFIVAILYLLGLRIHELQTHTWNAFRKVQGDWWFFVQGKGGKLGKVPVNQSLLEAVICYRRHLKLRDYPEPHEETALIQSWHSPKPLSCSQMNKLLKKLSCQAAIQFFGQPEKQAKLKKFSAHWLRHFSASQQDRMGIQFKHIKANHRHVSDETTRRYIHALDKERHNDMEKLSMQATIMAPL